MDDYQLLKNDQSVSQVEQKIFETYISEINSIYDIVANRVEDLRTICDSILGSEPTSEGKEERGDEPSRCYADAISYKLRKLYEKSDELLLQVRRLNKLV